MSGIDMSLKNIDPEFRHDKVTEELWQYVFHRDSGICQRCAKAGGHAHHIKYRSQLGCHCANNLILLCDSCHHREHNYESLSEVFYKERVDQNEKRFRRMLV